MINTFLGYNDFVNYLTPGYSFLGAEGATKMAEHHLGNLQKSLATTGIVAVDGTTGADALKQEDLIPTILSTELAMQYYAPFWTSLHKKPCISDVVQQTNLTNYGGSRRMGFIDDSASDGGITYQDPSMDRRALKVKFLGGQYQVLRNALAVQALGLGSNPDVGNAEQVASEARLQRLILNANEISWHGDNSINSLEPTGVLEQIRDEYTTAKPTRYNLNGSPITQETMADIKRLLYSNGAPWTDFWAPPTVLGDIEKQLIAHMRAEFGTGITLSNYADAVLTQGLGGNPQQAKIHRDLHLDTPFAAEPTVADSGAPTKPASVTAAAASGSGNVWGTYLPANTYYYSVAAVGVRGRSDIRALSGSVTSTASQKVTLTITNAAQATGTVKFFEIYRGTSATNRMYLTRVAGEAVTSGGTTTFVDEGEFVPGCATAAALSNMALSGGHYDIQVRQLLPLLKIKLPVALFAEQGGWLLGMTPQVCRPAFQLVLENIGPLT